jgi:hypothetical protein
VSVLEIQEGIAENAGGIHKPDMETNGSARIGVGDSETAFTTIKLLLLQLCTYIACDFLIYMSSTTFPLLLLLQER